LYRIPGNEPSFFLPMPGLDARPALAMIAVNPNYSSIVRQMGLIVGKGNWTFWAGGERVVS